MAIGIFLVFILALLLTVAIFVLLRPLELKFIAMGLLTALIAVVFERLPADAGRPVGAGVPGEVFVGSEATATMGRMAFVLVLGGVAAGVLGRWGYSSVPLNPEEARRDNLV